MAKRRRLTAPDAAELKQLEEGFDAMPPLETKGMVPPIAQVAGEAAAGMVVTGPADRAEQARNRTDAERLRAAEGAGLLAVEIPLAEIAADHLSRDRVALSGPEMDELKASLRSHGQRTPIEVMRLEEGFGLISGWRRLRALGELLAETGEDSFAKVRAFVRVPASATEAYVAMVEENEIRANLSHYERGRLAAVAAGQGVFDSVQAAVNELFASASKAKRSKIRSFAMIHETLGDLLAFPTDLSERAGLQLAASLRAMGAEPFRQALAQTVLGSAAEETQVLDAVMATEKAEKDPARGGRPATAVTGHKLEALGLTSGGVVKADLFVDGLTIRLTGQELSPYEARQILERVRNMANRE